MGIVGSILQSDEVGELRRTLAAGPPPATVAEALQDRLWSYWFAQWLHLDAGDDTAARSLFELLYHEDNGEELRVLLQERIDRTDGIRWPEELLENVDRFLASDLVDDADLRLDVAEAARDLLRPTYDDFWTALAMAPELQEEQEEEREGAEAWDQQAWYRNDPRQPESSAQQAAEDQATQQQADDPEFQAWDHQQVYRNDPEQAAEDTAEQPYRNDPQQAAEDTAEQWNRNDPEQAAEETAEERYRNDPEQAAEETAEKRYQNDPEQTAEETAQQPQADDQGAQQPQADDQQAPQQPQATEQGGTAAPKVDVTNAAVVLRNNVFVDDNLVNSGRNLEPSVVIDAFTNVGGPDLTADIDALVAQVRASGQDAKTTLYDQHNCQVALSASYLPDLEPPVIRVELFVNLHGAGLTEQNDDLLHRLKKDGDRTWYAQCNDLVLLDPQDNGILYAAVRFACSLATGLKGRGTIGSITRSNRRMRTDAIRVSAIDPSYRDAFKKTIRKVTDKTIEWV